MYDSSGAILALCGITQNQRKIVLFLQCGRWEPGQIRTDQDRSRRKPWESEGKLTISGSCVHGTLDGRPVASRGRRWDLQGDMQKPLGKRWFPVCANIIPGAPVPSWAEQDRAGHSTPKSLEIDGKINNSTNTASRHSEEEIRSGNFRITFQRL